MSNHYRKFTGVRATFFAMKLPGKSRDKLHQTSYHNQQQLRSQGLSSSEEKKRRRGTLKTRLAAFKDGAIVIPHTFCASRDTRISYFLINTGIFLRGSKLCGGRKTLQVLLVSKKKIGGNHAFFRDN